MMTTDEQLLEDIQARENIKKWLAALRSGKYRQGYGHLRKNDRFCCLGVACDIFQDHLDVRAYNYDTIPYLYKPRKKGNGAFSSVVLPENIKNMLKLHTNDGKVLNNLRLSNGDEVDSLADLNDSGHASFNQIADFIEENWNAIFTITKEPQKE